MVRKPRQRQTKDYIIPSAVRAVAGGSARSLASCSATAQPQRYPEAAGAAEGRVIVGVGLDIAEVARVEAAVRRHGRAFLERVFTPAEIAYCEQHRDKFARYAGRFAAKEAAMKALGTGWRCGVRWRDLEVSNLPGSRPALQLSGRSKQLAEQMRVRNITLSITHTGNFALAEVIFES